MQKPERRKLERVQYWQGQMLRAQDFLNLQGVEAQRRWWHNRAIHNAYGVAEGLEATLVPANAPTGVCVSPGVAYDIFGRELILERTQTVALPTNVPTGDPPMTLLVRYLPPGHNLSPDEITEVCWTQRGSVRPGTLIFLWRVASCVTPADGVAIFNLIYTGTTPTQNQSFSPIGAEALSRPLLGSGATIPGQTAWEPWTAGYTTTAGAVSNPALAGVQTWVDTSGAGFTDCPCYFAWLEGPLFNSPSLLPALIPNVADASITGFTFRMWLPPPPFYGREADRSVLLANLNSTLVNTSSFDLFAQQQDLYVSWIGCQMQGRACSCSQGAVVTQNSD